jgi:hypothetical protein
MIIEQKLNNPNSIIILAHQQQAKQLHLSREKYLTLDMIPEALYGLNKPVVIDYLALQIMISEMERYYENLLKDKHLTHP